MTLKFKKARLTFMKSSSLELSDLIISSTCLILLHKNSKNLLVFTFSSINLQLNCLFCSVKLSTFLLSNFSCSNKINFCYKYKLLQFKKTIIFKYLHTIKNFIAFFTHTVINIWAFI